MHIAPGNVEVSIFSFHAADNSNPSVRQYAADALGKIGNQIATAPPVKNLNDSDLKVRWATAEALRMLDK